MEASDSVTVIKAGKVVGSVRTEHTSEQELARMRVGRSVMLTVKNDTVVPQDAKVVYQVRDLTTENLFGKKVVNKITFDVHKGEILGIAGVEGNGQSELVKLLSGLMTSSDGSILFEGRDVTNWWPRQIRRAGIGIIPEDRYAQGLCKEMSIGDNCIAGYHDHPTICRHRLLHRKAINHKRNEMIETYSIRVGDIKGNVSSLSGGNAQKIVVARELSEKPRLLIACQPT